MLYYISFELSCYYYSLRRRGGRPTGVVRKPRHWPLLLVSYRTASTREFPPPPANWPGLKHKQARTTETPNGSIPLTYPNCEVAPITRCSAPYSLCQHTTSCTPVLWVLAGVYIPWETVKNFIYLLSESPSVAPTPRR